MSRILIISILILLINTNCSLDTKSGIWTNNDNFKKIAISNKKSELLFSKNVINQKEFNQSFLIRTPLKRKFENNFYQTNNDNLYLINDNLNKSSQYKFSKIKYFNFFEPRLVFDKKNLIFFNKEGSIIKFDDKSKNVWKKNYYNKKEKKLLPLLNFSTDGNILIVTDSLSNYYALEIETGELIWKKSHNSIFISDIKIDNGYFFVIDSNNEIHCFSLLNGKRIWNFRTDNELIKSQKKLSIVYDDKNVYFNNSKGDIYSLNKENGNLAWITPTNIDNQNQSFFLKNSKLVLSNNSIYFSNNFNNFFSLDKNNGFINWGQNINSDLKPVIINNLILTISLEGYLYIVEKNTGNIIRITDVFNDFKDRKRKTIYPVGFILSNRNIYLSLNTGKILEIDIASGRHISTLKISRDTISKPFINDKKMFVVKNNSIIRLN